MAASPIERFLAKGASLKPESSCGFYVTATRERYSVAIVATKANSVIKALYERGLIQIDEIQQHL